MFELGQKITISGLDAVVLVEGNQEVLIQLARNHVKWIDKRKIDRTDKPVIREFSL